MAEVDVEAIANRKTLFTEFKGAIAEQFVFQELRQSLTKKLYYWSNDNGSAEIDFLTQDSKGNIIPIEVKSGINLRAKSLSFFAGKYSPKYAIRTSLADYKVNIMRNIGNMGNNVDIIDMPIYAVANVRNILR
jgi:predicted AAA+ superfamily ATPase